MLRSCLNDRIPIPWIFGKWELAIHMWVKTFSFSVFQIYLLIFIFQSFYSSCKQDFIMKEWCVDTIQGSNPSIMLRSVIISTRHLFVQSSLVVIYFRSSQRFLIIEIKLKQNISDMLRTRLQVQTNSDDSDITWASNENQLQQIWKKNYYDVIPHSFKHILSRYNDLTTRNC